MPLHRQGLFATQLFLLMLVQVHDTSPWFIKGDASAAARYTMHDAERVLQSSRLIGLACMHRQDARACQAGSPHP